MDFLFHFQLLIGVIAQITETDLVESTTVQQLWAGLTTKKLILDIFSIRPNCQPIELSACQPLCHTQVMLQTVTLFYIHCVPCMQLSRKMALLLLSAQFELLLSSHIRHFTTPYGISEGDQVCC
jgi:hypothetical protein